MARMAERAVRRGAGAGWRVVLSFAAVAIASGEAAGLDAPTFGRPPLGNGAPGEGLRLEWRAPPECPQEEHVLSQVAVLAAKDEVRWDRFQLIRGQLEPTASGWRLALEFVAADSVRTRVIQSAGCAELADAAAVAIVLAHRSAASATADWDPSPPPAVQREARGAAAPAESAASPSRALGGTDSPKSVRHRGADDDAPRTALAAGVEASLDPITLGAAALGASVGLELRSEAGSASLYAVGFPSVTSRLGAGQAVEIGLWTGGVRGCYGWGQSLDTCLLAELGQVTARGVGLDQAREGRDLWAAPGLSLGLRSTPFDGLVVTTRLSVFHPLVRGRFRIDESEVVHRIPFLGFRAALGVDLPLL